MNSCHYNRSFHRIPKWQTMRILSGILEGESFILVATEETPLKGRTRLNMRRHEVEGGSLVSSRLVQWTSNSSGGSREDGKSGKSALVQMKRENQNPRCNPSFQPAIFFFLSSLVRLLSALCDLSLSLFPPSLSPFILSFSPSFLRHRTLYTIDFCAPSVSESFVVPLREILRVKNLHSTRQCIEKKWERERERERVTWWFLLVLGSPLYCECNENK